MAKYVAKSCRRNENSLNSLAKSCGNSNQPKCSSNQYVKYINSRGKKKINIISVIAMAYLAKGVISASGGVSA
jgi:hypothetical protein